jgi:methyl-accepting chemotaxis protein
MKRPLRNRIRVGLGVLITLATLLVLHVAFAQPPAGNSSGPTGAYAQAPGRSAGTQSPEGFLLRQRAAVGLGIILLASSGGLWWYLERLIFTPLEDMTGVVAAMSEGHLDQTLDTGSGTELARLAELINTFSVNQQEGLLFAWNQAGSGLQCLQTIAKSVQSAQNTETGPSAILEEVQHTREYLEGIRELVRTYYLYDVCLEDQKALAAEDVESLSAKCPSEGAELPSMKSGNA